MKDIVEIRWHGRGGQGAKTASLLLADAAFNTGKYVQGFPEYGPERMGATITAYNRIRSERSTVHSKLYFPDYVVVVDETCLLYTSNPFKQPASSAWVPLASCTPRSSHGRSARSRSPFWQTAHGSPATGSRAFGTTTHPATSITPMPPLAQSRWTYCCSPSSSAVCRTPSRPSATWWDRTRS